LVKSCRRIYIEISNCDVQLKKRKEKSLRHKIRNKMLESIDSDLIAWNLIQEAIDLQLIESLEFLVSEHGDANENKKQ